MDRAGFMSDMTVRHGRNVLHLVVSEGDNFAGC